MFEHDDARPQPKGLSGGQLVLMFLAGVAVCALFFSAGFLVGYNERLSKAAPVTEQVGVPSEIPPLVTQSPASANNATASKSQPPATGGQEPLEVTHPEPLRPQPLPAEAKAQAEPSPKPGAASQSRAPSLALREETAAKPGAPASPPSPGSVAARSNTAPNAVPRPHQAGLLRRPARVS